MIKYRASTPLGPFPRDVIECLECDRVPIAKGLCATCYNHARNKARALRFAQGLDLKHVALPTYDAAPSPTLTCAKCGRTWRAYRGAKAYSLCKVCRNDVSTQAKNHRLSDAQTVRLATITVCDLCGERLRYRKSGTARDAQVDHDHACCPGAVSCGRCVRGFICAGCNQDAGSFDRIIRSYGVDRMTEYVAGSRAAPDPAPLDVERLARALGNVVPEPDDQHEYTVTDDLWYAAAIAREYAKEEQP